MLLLRQLIDPTSSTYTYLLADGASGKAVLIDSVFEQARRDAALIEELGLELVATLETHVHADHVTASWLHRRRFGSVIALAPGNMPLLRSATVTASGSASANCGCARRPATPAVA